MSWINFLTVIFIVYIVYYLFNLLFDLFISPGNRVSERTEDELFLTETYSPELISFEEPQPEEEPHEKDSVVAKTDKAANVSSAFVSSGGVGLKQLFSLAKDNLIEYTKAIPY